jgi:hypothetical protein
MKQFWVYMMSNKSRRLYTGLSSNIVARVTEHKLNFTLAASPPSRLQHEDEHIIALLRFGMACRHGNSVTKCSHPPCIKKARLPHRALLSC